MGAYACLCLSMLAFAGLCLSMGVYVFLGVLFLLGVGGCIVGGTDNLFLSLAGSEVHQSNTLFLMCKGREVYNCCFLLVDIEHKGD